MEKEKVKREKVLISCRDQSICRRLIMKYGEDYVVFHVLVDEV